MTEKLRALALAARDEPTFYHDLSFAKFATPTAVLALLDEIDRLKAEKVTLEKQWSRVLAAADKAHGPEAIRFKLSLYKNGRAINTFPSWLDGRWVSFVFAEDDAHIGYIAKALDAAKGDSHEHRL